VVPALCELQSKGSPISKRTGRRSHTLYGPATIILRVAQHHPFLRTAQQPTLSPPFAATIARVGDCSPPPPHSGQRRDNEPPASLPAPANTARATPLPIYTAWTRLATSPITKTRCNASTTRPVTTTTCEHVCHAPRLRDRRSRPPARHTL
jgi:hypothetical protein